MHLQASLHPRKIAIQVDLYFLYLQHLALLLRYPNLLV